jgi:hypothetical protein
MCKHTNSSKQFLSFDTKTDIQDMLEGNKEQANEALAITFAWGS